MDVELGDAPAQLETDDETAIYRVVEDAVRAGSGDREAALRYDRNAGRLDIRVCARSGTVHEIARLRARVELLGGAIETNARELLVRIPMASNGRAHVRDLRPARPDDAPADSLRSR